MTGRDPDGAEPRWLTADERSAWLALAVVTMRLPTALDQQLRRDAGLRLFEYHALAGLSESPDRTRRMSDLADLTQGSLPRLSQVVTRLEDRGWVRRSPDPRDGRATLVTLTDAGWEKVVAAAPGHAAEVRRLVVDPLTSAQVDQLGSIARRILTAIDPNDPVLDEWGVTSAAE